MSALTIGGLPVVTLVAAPVAGRPSIVEAVVLPGRGFMLLQARLALPSGERLDLLHAPDAKTAAAELNGGSDDFAGNKAFSFGGALLAPYANRIRGRPLASSREIATEVNGRAVRLPRNWGGKAPGAEAYAMHGLILDQPIAFDQPAPNVIEGRWMADDFGGRWPGRAELCFAWRLEAGALRLSIDARNAGAAPLPMGLGWHPYFRLPSGRREQAALRLPATLRAEVNDYDEVLPTGTLSPVDGGPYDFREGRRLADLFLDDCFTGLTPENGRAVAELRDPAAGLGLRIAAAAPPVRAFQVYAPPDRPFVVLEPQFNLADPFGTCWRPQVETGMAIVAPGEHVAYEAQVEAFSLAQNDILVT